MPKPSPGAFICSLFYKRRGHRQMSSRGHNNGRGGRAAGGGKGIHVTTPAYGNGKASMFVTTFPSSSPSRLHLKSFKPSLKKPLSPRTVTIIPPPGSQASQPQNKTSPPAPASPTLDERFTKLKTVANLTRTQTNLRQTSSRQAALDARRGIAANFHAQARGAGGAPRSTQRPRQVPTASSARANARAKAGKTTTTAKARTTTTTRPTAKTISTKRGKARR